MHDLLVRLFPICRSLTGPGVRETFRILGEFAPIEVHEIPSGTRCFDWTVPPEWTPREAWLESPAGKRIVDFRACNLHLVGYSEPFSGVLPLSELKRHLYSLPEQPRAIPYVTSYYSKNWGFCLPHELLESLEDGDYRVHIDTSLSPGHLTFGDLTIPGDSREEILLSTYVCHPSLANNELSGPIVATYLARYLLSLPRRRFTYRFVFVPETIGAIAYLSLNLEAMLRWTRAGYVLTCCGDPGPYSYLPSRQGEAEVDRITRNILTHSSHPVRFYSFLERGSDERQYCSPGVDLPVGSLMRSKYGEYPQYHTSLDDPSFVTAEGLEGTLRMYAVCLNAIENNFFYQTGQPCEPQLGKRGLYPAVSTSTSAKEMGKMMDLLAYADGTRDLADLAETIRCSVLDLIPIAQILESHGLLRRLERRAS